MYEVRNTSDIKEWIGELIKRGYFIIVVSLLDQRRLIDWCGTN